jgi:hypothetical protein
VTVAPDEIANVIAKVKVLAEDREITIRRAELIPTVTRLLAQAYQRFVMVERSRRCSMSGDLSVN